MLKFINMNRCTLCTMVSVQTSPSRTFKPRESTSADFKEFKARLPVRERTNMRKVKCKQFFVRSNQNNINAITSLLQKYNVDTSRIKEHKNIFNETQWTVEKRIMLMQEMGVSNITTSHIANFSTLLFLSVSMYKATLEIDPEVNLAKRLLSNVQLKNFDDKIMDDVDEKTLPMKIYYYKCLLLYVKNELQLTDEQLKRVSYKRYKPILYNSFRLLERILKLIKKDLNFSNYLIQNNYYWLFAQHPDHSLAVINMISSNFNELNVTKVLQRYPKTLYYDLEQLEILISHMKHYQISSEMIQSAPEIFSLDPAEFKARVVNILKNPMSLVYQKHPRFLNLIRDYHVTLPRLQYLQEHNFKYATIHSLTTFHNYVEQLTSVKKMSKLNIVSFLELEYPNEAQNLFVALKKHPNFSSVPLSQMHESLNYLKKKYTNNVIFKYIYAILYSKNDLEAAYNEILEDPILRRLSPQLKLAVCLYKIETKYHFTGNAVLNPDSYFTSSQEERNKKYEEENEGLKDEDIQNEENINSEKSIND